MMTRAEHIEFNNYRRDLKDRINASFRSVLDYKTTRRKMLALKARVMNCRAKTLAGLKRYDRERKKIEAEYTLWKLAN